MIERIADKPSYAAIDPVFVRLPPRDHDESFDAALSRATEPQSSAAAARESEQRRRERDSVERSQPSQHADRPRERDENRSSVEDHQTGAAEFPADRALHQADAAAANDADANNSVNADAGQPAAAQDAASNIPVDGRTPDDVSSDDATDAAEAAVEALVVAAASGGADPADSSGRSEHAIENLTAGAATTEGVDAAELASAGERAKQVSPVHSLPADSAAELSSTIDAVRIDGGLAKTEQAATATSSEHATVLAASGQISAEQSGDAAKTHDAALIAAANPQTLARVAANSAAPAGGAGPLRANAGRESRSPQRTVAAKADRASLAGGSAATGAAQGVSAIVAQAGAAASDRADSAGAAQSPPPTDAPDAHAAPPTQSARSTSTSHEAAAPRAVVGRHSGGRSGGANRPDGPHVESEVQRVRLIQRVARAFQSLGDGGGEIRLRLSPPSLGSIKLEVTVQAGVMSARIETDTPAAKTLLVDNLPALRERLAAHDLKVSQFNIETSADSQQQNQFAGRDRTEDRAPRSPIGQTRRPANEPTSTVARVHVPKGALDVLI